MRVRGIQPDWKKNNAQVVILGAGESGVGAALLAQKEQYSVFVSDKGNIKDSYKKELEAHNIPFEEGEHTIGKLIQADVIVKSPGIPDYISMIQTLKSKGIPVISEIEFAAQHTSAFLIGISGSNGKTTTTKLTYHLLKTAGFDVAVGGNIGRSFARLLATKGENQRGYYVLELSSFQLDGVVDFCPNIAILLNITPDHLDRYGYKMENYVRAKFRMVQNQQAEDVFIFNKDNLSMQQYMAAHTFPQQMVAIEAHHYENARVQLPDYEAIDLKESGLRGKHNAFNVACVVAVAKILGIRPDTVRTALGSFVNVPHRLEVVATIKGVEYINDSKATNVDAVFYALQAMTKSIVWIAGGTDKGNDYTAIKTLVREKVKALICLGVDNQKLLDTFLPMLDNVQEAKSMKEAVTLAQQYAQQGDVVLLSPACASFDLFENYIDRGEQFKKNVGTALAV